MNDFENQMPPMSDEEIKAKVNRHRLLLQLRLMRGHIMILKATIGKVERCNKIREILTLISEMEKG